MTSITHIPLPPRLAAQASASESRARSEAEQKQLAAEVEALKAAAEKSGKEHAAQTKILGRRVAELEAEVRAQEELRKRMSAAGGANSVRGRQLAYCEELKEKEKQAKQEGKSKAQKGWAAAGTVASVVTAAGTVASVAAPPQPR